MTLVEVTHIDGGCNHWMDRIDGGFRELMHDLVMMVKELIWHYKKGMNAAKSHYCARLSRLRLTIFVEKSCIELSEFPSKGRLKCCGELVWHVE